ncbi:MAG: SLBB domain-containing protein [Candidatus Cloacimonadaceae bacterium]|nr:SLBB domain-containing protein [Candidatus Cloacimonadaceae bacterium]
MKKLLLLLLILGIALGVYAQGTVSFTPTSNISAYTYDGIRSGVEKLKMNTYILGQVAKPGLYTVPDDTNFLTLLALAGGPREDAKLSKIRIIRPSNEEKDRIIWVNLKKYMETGDETLLPAMKPGDTIVISGTIFYAFSKVADFLSKAAIALSVYNLVTNIK